MNNDFTFGPEFIDKLRYDHMLDGSTVEEIAYLESLEAMVVYASVGRAGWREHTAAQAEVMELRRQGAIQNERFRKPLREALPTKWPMRIERLLGGDRDK